MTKLYPHQKRIYDQLVADLSSHRVVCIAAVTGFGKTELMAKFIEENPDKRFLILAHGQTALRTNFYERLKEKPKLRSHVHEIANPQDLGDARISVALPQTIFRHLRRLPPVDYLIVDEAHEYYLEEGDANEKKMYGAILRWHGRRKEILLTASHYPLKRVRKIFFSREEALAIGRMEDVTIEVAETSFDVKDISEAYNNSGELVQSLDVSASIADIIPYLKPKNFPVIVSRHSIEAADELAAYLAKSKDFRGKFSVSHSQCDKDSSEIAAFKAGKFPILIVVQRGALGFDFPELRTYIDASFTRSLIRTEQMVGRVARQHPLKKGKRFVKLALESRVDEAYLLMAGVLALGEKDIYRTWNGIDKSIPIKDEVITRIRAERERWRGESSSEPASYLMSFSEYLGIKSLKTLTFSTALEVIRKVNGPREERQTLIRELALSGKRRPGNGEEGNTIFRAYLSPSSKVFEQAFFDEIKALRPDWFAAKSKASSEEKKEQLIALANAGEPRPKRGVHPLGEALKQYTNRGLKRGCYDAKFDQAIRKLAPHWFT